MDQIFLTTPIKQLSCPVIRLPLLRLRRRPLLTDIKRLLYDNMSISLSGLSILGREYRLTSLGMRKIAEFGTAVRGGNRIHGEVGEEFWEEAGGKGPEGGEGGAHYCCASFDYTPK